MALSAPRTIFGIHSCSPYSRSTFLPYGQLKVLKGSSFGLSGELAQLYGGSSKFAWAAEESTIKAELSVKTSEFSDFLFELFLGKAPTAVTTADTSGTVTTLANKNGTSCKHATTGIASVGVKAASKTDLKFGKYVIKVASATTVNVYSYSDADFAHGTAKTFEDDNLKITASALTIVASTATEVPGFGVELTGGSGTIGMTVGDTAYFEVLPLSNKSMSVVVGASANTFTEFGAICMAKKNGSNELFELDIYKLKGAGMPLPFETGAFAETELKAVALYDSALDAIFKVRTIQESA
jgi:hypothetical protein